MMVSARFAFLALLAAGSAHAETVSGDQIFKQRCQMCHAAAPGLMAPSLKGVVGRKAGATQFSYSSALKAAKLSWTKENLDKFLAAPTKLVPGTRMVISVSDPAQRKAVIAYLATLK
jgi:cytochrome c